MTLGVGLSVMFIQVYWQLATAQDPSFNATPVNVTAIKDQPAVLPCTVENKNEYLIVWMNPRRIVLSSDDRRVIDDTRMSIERPFIRDWNLHIRNINVQDEGEYTCQINTDPIQIKRVRLKVHVPAEIDTTSSSNNVTVKEGENVKLQCVASGIPEPAITWYRNTPQTNQMREHVGTTGEVLIIHNISRYCAGLYECEASNLIAQPSKRSINVDVQFPPEVYFRTPRRVSQEVGKEVMLECFVAAFPQGVGEWKMHGKPVGEGVENRWKYRSEIYKEDQFTVIIYLMIINLEKHDFGTYTCEASNALGTDSETIVISEYIKRTPPPPTDPPTLQPRLNVMATPNRPLDNLSGKGEINAGRVQSVDGNPNLGYANNYFSSTSTSSCHQWCILSTVLLTFFFVRHLQPS